MASVAVIPVSASVVPDAQPEALQRAPAGQVGELDRAALRRSLAVEMGFVMPAVRILDNVQLEANTYIIKIKEVDAGSGKIWPNQFMVMDPMGSQVNLPGVHTTEPTFGLPATWIEPALRDEAELRGYSIIDPSTVISTHLTEVLKANVADLLSYANVQSLLSGLSKDQQKLVEDIVPGQISVSGIQRVLLPASEKAKISVRGLNFFYGRFHALKHIELDVPGATPAPRRRRR